MSIALHCRLRASKAQSYAAFAETPAQSHARTKPIGCRRNAEICIAAGSEHRVVFSLWNVGEKHAQQNLSDDTISSCLKIVSITKVQLKAGISHPALTNYFLL